MTSGTHLLTDDEMQSFIYNGMISLQPSLTPSAHDGIHHDLEAWFAENENPGNDILARIPSLKALFEDPRVDGALTSILGPDYLIHRHRHCHNHQTGASAQDNHKDYPVGGNIRDHHPRCVLILYYPQAVTPDMGPTAVQPGSQYYMSPQEDLEEITICCEKGTLVITHYEIWHRATENKSPRPRYMVKFLGMRTQEPASPAWHSTSSQWKYSGNQITQHEAICRHIWGWYQGAPNKDILESDEDRTACDVRILVSALEHDERNRIDHYYRISNQSKENLSVFAEALTVEAELKSDANLARNDYTNPSQLDVPFGLAAMGAQAVPGLVEKLAHPNWRVRAAAAGTLGIMGEAAHEASENLGAALSDENEWVRRNAAEALGNIGKKAENIVPKLLAALEDKRPVSKWSLSEHGFRENVAMALLKIIPSKNKNSFPAIKSLEQDTSEYVRCWARHINEGIHKIF